MLVRCSNCHTPFSLNERVVGPDGGGIRCSVCAHVFPVEAEQPLTWQIQTIDGTSFVAPDLGTVRRWIGEGRLHPDDHVSRTGKHWIRLGEMPEFSAAFAGFVDLPPLWRRLEDAPALETLGSLPLPIDDTGELGAVVDYISGDPSSGSELDLHALAGQLTAAAALATADAGEPRSEVSDVVPLDVDAVFPRDDRETDDREAELAADDREAEPAADDREAEPDEHPYAAYEANDAARAEAVLGLRDHDDELERGMTEDARETSLLDVVSHRLDLTTAPSMLASTRTIVEHDDADLELRQPSRWGSRAVILALAAGAAVVIGVPAIRVEALALARQVSGILVAPAPAEARPPELALAADAIAAADGLDQVSDALSRRLQDPALSPVDAAELRLVWVDVLVTRGLRTLVVAAMAGEIADAARYRAADDAEQAGQLFASTAVDHLDAQRVADTRVRLRLLQGRPLADVRAELGSDAPLELTALVEVASLWQPPAAAASVSSTPEAIVRTLEALPARSTLLELGLVLARHRATDDEGARATLAGLLARTPEHPAAIAMQSVLGGESPKEEAVGVAVSRPRKPERVEPPDPRAEAEADPESDPESDDTDDVPAPESLAEEPVVEGDVTRGLSTDTLIDRGCDAVDEGKAGQALPFLLKALERRPQDVDVLTCLGQAHAKIGNHVAALRHFDKALARAPRLLPALRGAARSHEHAGQIDAALKLYRRVLAIEPSDREALAFVEAHGASAP